MKIELLDRTNSHLLENIADQVFDHDINPITLFEFLDCPRHAMALAIDNGLVIGMASAVEYFHPDKPAQLWINEIGVTPARRNQGIGRQLISKLLLFAKSRGCSVAWLGTNNSNIAAQRCFESVPDGEQPQGFQLYEWRFPVAIASPENPE